MYYDNAVMAMQAVLAYAIPTWTGYTEDCGQQKTDGNQSGPIGKRRQYRTQQKNEGGPNDDIKGEGQPISLRTGQPTL